MTGRLPECVPYDLENVISARVQLDAVHNCT
jgi:hypothetical protein